MTSLLNFFKKRLPHISFTEKIAIEAGDVWWEGDLFSGHPHWESLRTFPVPKLSQEEKAFIDNQVSTLCRLINDWEIFSSHTIPENIWQYLKNEQFFGLAIEKQYGGKGFSAYAHSTIVSLIASRSLSVAVATMVPNSLGPGELLTHYGTEAQKNAYLPRLAKGEDIPCFALTGLDVGSDASRMTDTGIVCYEDFNGQKTLGIKLNFEKRYITLGPISTLLGLAFKLYDPAHLLGDKQDIGITLALIPLPHEGVEHHHKHLPLGLGFPNGAIRGKDVFIPIDYIIGGVAMAGQGWRMLMECLSIGRSISLPALSTGASQLCCRMTGAYSILREQFKQPIGYFDGVKSKFAYIVGLTYLIEATRRFTTIAPDTGKKPAIASAIAKYHLTEFSREVINHAMDIHAGRGIQMGPRNYLASPYIGAPVSITVEGANILTRNLIIFGQGAIRCHPFLRKEIEALANNDEKSFNQLVKNHVVFGLKNLGRLFYKSKYDRMSAALAFCTDISLLVLGGELKRHENISARLGDVLSYLYIASAVMKYHQDFNQPEEEKDFVEWSQHYLLYKMQIALSEFCENFPKRWIGKMLKWLIFPLGKKYQLPSDKLNEKLADKLSVPGLLRDKLTSCCYSNEDPNDLLGRMENALNLKIHKAQGYEAAVKDAIQVDEF